MAEGIIDLVSALMGGATGAGTTTDSYIPLSYPLSVPSAGGVRRMTWSYDTVRSHSESPFTLQRQYFQHAGERWRVQVELPPMPRELAAEWRAFILNMDGGAGTVLFGDVFNDSPRGAATGTPVVDGAAQTGRTLNIKGANINVTNWLKRGDKIQVGLHLYEVTRDVGTDGDGMATLDIFPRLRSNILNEQVVVTYQPRGAFRIDSERSVIYSTDIDGFEEVVSISLIEDI